MAFMYILFGWMFTIITASQENESISFSPVSKSLSNSYWYGNISISKDSSIIEDGIRVKLQLNQYQGLLFYAIDSKYRTLWVEFNQGILEISFYNFMINEPDMRRFKLENLCIHLTDNKMNLNFSLQNEEIVINCNGNILTTSYVRSPEILTEENLNLFNKIMILPVPIFGIDPLLTVHLWIGNIPSTNADNVFQNINEVKSNRDNLWGCIESFSIKDSVLKLATTGDHVGEMIKPYCNPVCISNSCYNNGKCSELWRGRFSCDCGLSQYVGDRCDLDYSVKFNGSFSFSKSIYFKFQKLQFSFKPAFTKDYHELKILSLKFLKNQSFQFYIDTAGYLHARFVRTTDWIIDEIFKLKMMHNHNYLLFADVNMDEIHIKLVDSYDRSLVDNIIVRSNEANVVIENILIGDSHTSNMDWMRKFQGCLTNLMLKADSRKFIWNEINNFNTFPSCKEIPQTTVLPKSNNNSSELRSLNGNRSINMNNPSNKVIGGYIIYIVIASLSVMILIVTLIIVLLLKYKSVNHKALPDTSDKIKLTDNLRTPQDQSPLPEQHRLTTNLSNSNNNSLNTYPSPIYMTFKPAYKARSITSSVTNRSMMSLPNAVTPTLVTPEVFEDNEYQEIHSTECYNESFIDGNSSTPKITWKHSKFNFKK